MFRVEWLNSALNDLANIWLVLDSEGRTAITDATNRIDQELADAADTVGESRSGSLRIHYVKPLGLTFDVNSVNLTARIVNVWFVK